MMAHRFFVFVTLLLLNVPESFSAFLPRHGSQQRAVPLFGKRMKFQPPPKVVEQTECIQIQPDGSDVWRTMDVVDALNRGGVGVLPTDTGYCLVTPLGSKAGLERLLRIQNLEGCEAPIHILCSNIATIDEYCYNIDKMAFKILKKNLPGLYTFILPGKTNLPKAILDGRKQLHTVGVRMPADPVIRYLQDELLDGMPLLASSLEADEEDDDDHSDDDDQTKKSGQGHLDHGATWYKEVDFIVDAGCRPQVRSTVYDLTRRGDPTLIREGLGELELAL